MTATIASNTQAILLLTAPLRSGPKGADGGGELLSLGEYNEFARALHERQRTPSDLLGSDGSALIAECHGALEPTRIERLLARGFALAQAIEHWQARGIWVVSRADAQYPRRLKLRLREAAPPVLYGCGDASLCETGGLAIVGSRDASEEQLQYAAGAGRIAARFGRTVVSGGARGVDQAAMTAALDAGGHVVGVLADGLSRAAVDRRNRDALRAGRLVLLSICDPNAGFHTGIAMQRNRLIYAFADAALVVNAEFEKGGTWTGAVEQLDRLRLVPVYLRATGELGKGMTALRERGALPWPAPQSEEDLERALGAQPKQVPVQGRLGFGRDPGTDVVRESADPSYSGPPVETEHRTPAEQLFLVVRRLLADMSDPKTEAEVALLLGVSKTQAKEWLTRLVAAGDLEKTKRPVRYRAKAAAGGTATPRTGGGR